MNIPPTCNPRDPIVELSEVSHREGGQLVLNRVSWRIHQGESWGILGANGAGKTMLLRVVAGWLWPNAGGHVLRLGRPLLDLRELRRSIGWVSHAMTAAIPRQERVLDTVVSGRFAQLGLMPASSDRPKEQDYAQARAFLIQLDVEGLLDRRFGSLSQGEQQKVLLARARMARPLLLILDEPCVGLDPGSRESFLETVSVMLAAPQAPSILLVTHNIEEILPCLRQTLVISQGKVLQQGATRQVMQPVALQTIYGRVPRELLEREGRFWPIW